MDAVPNIGVECSIRKSLRNHYLASVVDSDSFAIEARCEVYDRILLGARYSWNNEAEEIGGKLAAKKQRVDGSHAPYPRNEPRPDTKVKRLSKHFLLCMYKRTITNANPKPDPEPGSHRNDP